MKSLWITETLFNWRNKVN